MKVHGVELRDAHDRVIEDFTRRGLPTFEAESMAAWLSAVGPETTAIDVGAYTGLYAIAAAKAGASVHAIEPNPEVFLRLQENVAANQVEVRLHHAAAGALRGNGRLITSSARLTSGGRVALEDGPVRILRVDDLIHAWRVSAIKIDVEGGEVAVLLGAMHTLSGPKPLLIVEALDDDARGSIEAVLSPLGYSWERADERNLICRATS